MQLPRSGTRRGRGHQSARRNYSRSSLFKFKLAAPATTASAATPHMSSQQQAYINSIKVIFSEYYDFIMGDLYASWVNTSNVDDMELGIAIPTKLHKCPIPRE